MSSGSRQLAATAIVWATATLVHLIALPFWARTWQGWLLVFCVSIVLFRPSSPGRCTLLCSASLLNWWHSLPFVPNHILFEGLVNGTIMLAVVSRFLPWVRRNLHQSWRLLVAWRGPILFTCALAMLLMAFDGLEKQLGGASLFGIALFRWLFPGANAGYRSSNDAALNATLEDVFSLMRVGLTLVYLWSVVQKLNWDFLNPAVSCAVQLQSEMATRFGLPEPPAWTFPGLIALTLSIELLIPLLLWIPGCRLAGFLLAWFFHVWLAFHPSAGIYSFSALVLSMLIAFLSSDQRRRIWFVWRRRMRGLRLVVGARYWIRIKPGELCVVGFFAFGIVSGLHYHFLGENPSTFYRVNAIGLGIFLCWAIWLGVGYAGAGWAKSAVAAQVPVLRSTWGWLGVLLMFANGLAPWLGLKTQTSYAMFSNLRTEFESNHLFLRRAPWSSYQDDMVEIVESKSNILSPIGSPQGIEQFANSGRIMPFFEVRRLLSRFKDDVRVVVLRNGQRQVIERRGGDCEPAEAFEAPSYLEAKLLWFRRHSAWTGPMHCTH